MELYQGCVENRQDPLKLGRCQVRVVGLHTHDKTKLKTEDLPWAYPMQPITSAAINGIGQSPIGPVEGTWVVIMFRDDDLQLPVMIGTIGGIPQEFGAIDSDPDGIILKPEPTNFVPTESPKEPTDVVTSGDDPKPVQTNGATGVTGTTGATGASSAVTSSSSDIPTEPPPEFTTLRDKRKASIVALLAACDKFGIKSKEVKCSILAMAGGESGYIPADEGYSYSADALKQVFYTTFTKKHPEMADKYARAPSKGMSREEFFNFVYDPANNGSGLGNTQSGDGGKYYGRGLTGITGRYAYGYYGNKIGVDLLANPGLLSSDLNVSAQASAMMIWDNTKKKFPKVSETANPDYFYAAKRAQGKDANAEGAARRLRYYEYFYGNKTPAGYTEDKSPAATPPASSDNSVAGSTNSGPTSAAAGPNGFRDPNNKYPLKSFLNEPDTNRLARGVKAGTVVAKKDSNRKTGIQKADGNSVDEPASAFAAKYPYNHVFESESGHVQEFDDTPGHERIHTFHRSGTFTEIDSNGTEVHHIVGDGYTIVDRNGVIYIGGECSITADGNINIMCQSAANISVAGDTTMDLGGNFELNVAKDFTVAVGGKFSMESAGDMTLQSDSNSHVISVGDTHLYTGGSSHIKSVGKFNLDANRVDINDGTAIGATTIGLNIPSAKTPLNVVLDYLQQPPSAGEDELHFETEEEWASPAGQARKAELAKQYGDQNPDNTPSQESAQPAGGTDKNTVASCSVIYGTETFTNDFKLSQHFTLGMLIDGGVNGKNKLKAQMGLTAQQIVCNLSQLCQNILEPMLAVLPNGIDGYKKTWQINSGFRASDNIPAGGVKSSDHMFGRAIDFTLLPYDSTKAQRNFELAKTIEKILPYDQIIMEYMSGGSNWVHIGYRGVKEGDTVGQGGTNRKMAFTMLNGSTYKKDANGQPAGFYLL